MVQGSPQGPESDCGERSPDRLFAPPDNPPGLSGVRAARIGRCFRIGLGLPSRFNILLQLLGQALSF